MKRRRLKRTLLLLVLAVAVLAYFGAAWWQSRKPPLPEVRDSESSVAGYATVSMLVDIMQAQLDGPGGWLPNDLPGSPGHFLDNVPSYQLGVLQVVRHTSRVLRDNLTRQRTSDAVHKETDLAFSAYANDPRKWAFPSAEGAFRRGNAALVRFREDLGGDANFYPRADNLIELLTPFISELGAVTALLLEEQERGNVGWFAVDDNFYYAQGVSYAMLGIMRAVRADFAPVLADKNAEEITGLIIDSLESAQFEPWIVTNGSKDGILANHSNNLKVFLDDARQKMKSLVTILEQG